MGSPFCQRQGCVLSQENWGGRYAKSDHLEDVSGKRGAKAGDIHEVIMEYSWDINNVNIRMVISFIHDIFMGYSWSVHDFTDAMLVIFHGGHEMGFNDDLVAV